MGDSLSWGRDREIEIEYDKRLERVGLLSKEDILIIYTKTNSLIDSLKDQPLKRYTHTQIDELKTLIDKVIR